MEYKEIETANNNKFRKTTDKSNGYLFDSQINTAKGVVEQLMRNVTRRNHVILAAKMQSGKTGVCNAVVNIITQTDLHKELCVNKYMFITGMNDNGLKKQTLMRVEQQCIGASQDNIYSGLKSKRNLSDNRFFVMKNSDLLKYEGVIDNSIIFIDEAHYGSNDKNVLSKFLYNQGINWKNTNDLISRNIYIVSVSATPFDEIVSDTKELKSIVELKPSKEYVGVSELLSNGLVLEADKDDINEGGPIFDYIDDACQRMHDDGVAGIIIIRTLKNNVIKEDPYITKTFDIFEMNSSGSNIDYKKFNECVTDLIAKNEFNKRVSGMKATKQVKGGIPLMPTKPLLVLIKGAFRAGITLETKAKDYIYMLYDYSIKADTTAQALLGRLCGYRPNGAKIENTFIYVNKKFADMYSAWENDMQNRTIVPCSKTTYEWLPNDVVKPLGVIGSRTCGNVAINLSEREIREIYQTSKQVKNRVKYIKQALPTILNRHNVKIDYDYVGEAVLSGKNHYTASTQTLRFDNFSPEATPYQFRPYRIKEFVNETGRNYLTSDDLGKKAVFVVLDAIIDNNGLDIKGNKRLLIYHVEVGHKIAVPNLKGLYRPHKDTAL